MATPDTTAPETPALNYADYMTPIDWFASSALSGMMSAGAFPHEAKEIARTAYKLANAMLAARQDFFQANPQYHPDTIHEVERAAWEAKRAEAAKLRREKRATAAKKGKAKSKTDSTTAIASLASPSPDSE